MRIIMRDQDDEHPSITTALDEFYEVAIPASQAKLTETVARINYWSEQLADLAGLDRGGEAPQGMIKTTIRQTRGPKLVFTGRKIAEAEFTTQGREPLS